MTEREVLNILGRPDQVRAKGDLGIVAEKYRWVYGIDNSGEFPHIGAVVFGTDSTVLMIYCPSRSIDKRLYISMPFSEEPQSAPSGMRCEIDEVSIDSESNGHYIRVSLVNGGGSDFRFAHDHTGIRFQLVLELYDKEKRLILQEPIFGYHSPCTSDQSEWPVLVVPAGGRISEDVPIWWRDVNDGVPAPGMYYVRVGFPFESGKYYASNLAEWQLPSGLSWRR